MKIIQYPLNRRIKAMPRLLEKPKLIYSKYGLEQKHRSMGNSLVYLYNTKNINKLLLYFLYVLFHKITKQFLC